MDKSKSGRKQPRKFDLIQIHELYNREESEEIQIILAESHPLLPRSSVDDIIDFVIAQAYDTEPTNPETVATNSDPSPELFAANPGLDENNPAPVNAVHFELTNPDPEEASNGQNKEKLYCTCNAVSSGEMIGCNNLDCSMEWFHFN